MATIQQHGVEEPSMFIFTHIEDERDGNTAELLAIQSELETSQRIARSPTTIANRGQDESAATPAEYATLLSEDARLATSPASNAQHINATRTQYQVDRISREVQNDSCPKAPEYDQQETSTAPPAYHMAPGQLACHSPGGRIITRVLANRIEARPLWDPERHGRPTDQVSQSFAVVLSISPSCTFADFKALLVPKLKARITRGRTSGPLEGEIIKAWTFVQWREPGKRLLGLKKGKLRNVDIDETNWPTIMVALRDRTLVGDLRVTFWNEVPLSDAEKARQLAVAQMYRATLRPYAAW